MKNSKHEVIYVGKAKNLKNRVCSYFRNIVSHNERVQKMIGQIYDFDFIVTDSEFDALILECSLIKQNKPKYNVLLKDSKGFCYIKITTNSRFPQIFVVSNKENDGATYLGPYVQCSHLFPIKQTVKNVNEIFMLPDCKINFDGNFRRKRPCLNFYIKKCVGVCCRCVSEDEYRKILDEAVLFLKNGSKSYVKMLKKQMEQASNELNYEQAIKLRDRIKVIEKIDKNSKIYLKYKSSIDVVSAASLENLTCFVVLEYANGSVNKMEHFICDGFIGLKSDSYKERIEEFVASYYYGKDENNYSTPEMILVDCDDFDLELYSKYLEQQFMHSVKIKLPGSGKKYRNLMEMAQTNALEILTTHLKQGSGKFKIVRDLSKVLGLKNVPLRIEAYDVSNLGDSAIVGAMVVFQNGWSQNSNYRKFKMKTVVSQNDYGSMEEMIKRRILRFNEGLDLSFSKKPDLILIDGGKEHVRAVKKVLKEENFDVACFGMVKDFNHRTRALTDEFSEINVASNESLFRFINQIQDEVHRFAIGYNRQIRETNALKLELSKIEGIGPIKAIQFLKNLSVHNDLKTLTAMEIAKMLKIKLSVAEKVKNLIDDLS